jgi:hypothetical protein
VAQPSTGLKSEINNCLFSFVLTLQTYTPAEASTNWPSSATCQQESEPNRTMIFPGGGAERDELSLRHIMIKRTTKTASPRTTDMAVTAMYPALSSADALRARAGMSGEMAEVIPSAATYGSLPAEAVAEVKSCNSRESGKAVAMRLACNVRHTF